MANLKYSSELLDDILFRAGEQTDSTSNFNAQALIYLNRAYRTLCMGGGEFLEGNNQNWWWLRKSPSGLLTILPSYTEGTVNALNGYSIITFSGAPALDLDGWFFQVLGHGDVFRITAHTASTSTATIDMGYTGESVAAASFRVFKLEYTLASDVLRLVAPMRTRITNGGLIEGMDSTSMDKTWPIHLAESGVPTTFSHIGEQKIRFNRYGSSTANDNYRVEYDYLYMPTDLTDSASEEPVVPLFYRHILSDMALAMLFIDKNDDRAALMVAAAKAGLQAMINENKKRWTAMSHRFGKIQARQDHRENVSTPLRTETGFIIG